MPTLSIFSSCAGKSKKAIDSNVSIAMGYTARDRFEIGFLRLSIKNIRVIRLAISEDALKNEKSRLLNPWIAWKDTIRWLAAATKPIRMRMKGRLSLLC